MRQLGGDRVRVLSAGSNPGASLNPLAVEVMREVGIDIEANVPQRWTEDMLGEVDVVVTMGCGDECPYLPGKRYLDWPLDDPAGRDLEFVRRVRDEIRNRVESLLADITAT